jgi:hypothetical protein
MMVAIYNDDYTNEKNAVEIAKAIAALGFSSVVKNTGAQDNR